MTRYVYQINMNQCKWSDIYRYIGFVFPKTILLSCSGFYDLWKYLILHLERRVNRCNNSLRSYDVFSLNKPYIQASWLILFQLSFSKFEPNRISQVQFLYYEEFNNTGITSFQSKLKLKEWSKNFVMKEWWYVSTPCV